MANKKKYKYAEGGWFNRNQQGIIGGIKAAAGLGLIATGAGAAAGAGLIASGATDIVGNVHTNQMNNLNEK